MKAKTSITLSMQLLVKIDKLIGENASRSAFIEKVLRDHLRDEEREAAGQRDLELINANADALNAKAEDTLEYQQALYFDLIQDQDHSYNAASSSPAREDQPETADERVVSSR
jgi:metal-responsive CopG/Arc/MetJ family transcriptional regulator